MVQLCANIAMHANLKPYLRASWLVYMAKYLTFMAELVPGSIDFTLGLTVGARHIQYRHSKEAKIAWNHNMTVAYK